jgi:CDGSH iron-sulfur domain-containing protein 3
MADPIVAQKAPFPMQVEAGKTYFWCACGRSAKQPFCDGAHKAVGLEPMKYQATESKTLYFCGCKQTSTKPLCDGTHSRI